MSGVPQQVVVHPRDPGSTRDAAEPDQRHPAYVLAQPDHAGDPRVQRRHRQPGHGGGDDEVDVGRRQVGGLERVDQRPRPQLDGVLDEEVVGVPEVAEPGVVRQRQHGVPAFDAGVGVEALEQGAVEAVLGDQVDERLGDLRLGVGVGRQRTAGSQDPHVCVLTGGGWGGSDEAADESRRQAWVDAAVAEADLDECVEDVPVAGRGPDAGVDHGGGLGEAGGDPRVPQVRAEHAAYVPAMGRTGLGSPGRRPGTARPSGRRRCPWRRRSRCPHRSSG